MWNSPKKGGQPEVGGVVPETDAETDRAQQGPRHAMPPRGRSRESQVELGGSGRWLWWTGDSTTIPQHPAGHIFGEQRFPRAFWDWFCQPQTCALSTWGKPPRSWNIALIRRRVTHRTSLVVQQLKLHAPSAGGTGSIPGQETRSCMLQLRPRATK